MFIPWELCTAGSTRRYYIGGFQPQAQGLFRHPFELIFELQQVNDLVHILSTKLYIVGF